MMRRRRARLLALLTASVAVAGVRVAGVQMSVGQGLPSGSPGRGRRGRRVAAVDEGGSTSTTVEDCVEPLRTEPDRHAELVSALRGLNFDHSAARTLAVDAELGGRVRQVRGAHLVSVTPSPIKSPELIATSEAIALLGLPARVCQQLLMHERLPPSILADIASYLSGNQLLPGAEPTAAVYCGHQVSRAMCWVGNGWVASSGM